MKKKLNVKIVSIFVVSILIIIAIFNWGDINLYYNSMKAGYYEDNNEFNECINIYTEMIDYKSDVYEYYLNRGVAHASLENYDEAEKDFMTALSLNQKDKDIYYNLYLIYNIRESSEKEYYLKKYKELNVNEEY